MVLTKADYDAMRRAIEWLRQHCPDDDEQLDRKLKCEGFEAAGEFAAERAQYANLKLRPWECSPCSVWGFDQASAIELRDRLVTASLSTFEPNPTQALAEAERKQHTAQEGFQ
jgi:hypothetical protein